VKHKLETLQKYCEGLEKDRNAERNQRLKVEEEQLQNNKNHEEEVQLRLKFEAKLNLMHSKHRDVCTKFDRVLVDFTKAKDEKIELEGLVEEKREEIVKLKTTNTEQGCTMVT